LERETDVIDWQTPQIKGGFENLRSAKNLSVRKNPVIQRRYYAPLSNRILDHPNETWEIRSAKTNTFGMSGHSHCIIVHDITCEQ